LQDSAASTNVPSTIFLGGSLVAALKGRDAFQDFDEVSLLTTQTNDVSEDLAGGAYGIVQALQQAYQTHRPARSDAVLVNIGSNITARFAQLEPATQGYSPLSRMRVPELILEHLGMIGPASSQVIIDGKNLHEDIATSSSLQHELDVSNSTNTGSALSRALATYAAHNYTGLAPESALMTKRIACVVDESNFRLEAMEVETLARYRMPVVVFILTDSRLGRGRGYEEVETSEQSVIPQRRSQESTELRDASLLYEMLSEGRYEKVSETVGSRGWMVRTENELREATEQSWSWAERHRMPTLVNVLVETEATINRSTKTTRHRGQERQLMSRL
jgi:thiamine pyrophosphate-dependent acetolactate synthase large subunit-like protein